MGIRPRPPEAGRRCTAWLVDQGHRFRSFHRGCSFTRPGRQFRVRAIPPHQSAFARHSDTKHTQSDVGTPRFGRLPSAQAKWEAWAGDGAAARHFWRELGADKMARLLCGVLETSTNGQTIRDVARYRRCALVHRHSCIIHATGRSGDRTRNQLDVFRRLASAVRIIPVEFFPLYAGIGRSHPSRWRPWVTNVSVKPANKIVRSPALLSRISAVWRGLPKVL